MKYGGYVDYFYEKFTTPLTHSMIIGDSRAMQGIQPKIINKRLSKSEFELPILNYSFTIAQSHIGPLYNKSIFKKLNPNTKNGLFIIGLNPWMLGSIKSNDNNKGVFLEQGHPPHNMRNVSLNPNFEYLVKNYHFFHFKSIVRKNSKLHKDGWLEESNLPKDSTVFKVWKKTQINIFNGFYQEYKVSEYRQKSLDTLIITLKKYGKVYIIRSPIDLEMEILENKFFPDFDKYVNSLSRKYNIKYFNYLNNKTINQFRTYDGHHIDKYGGITFTNSICDSIIKN